MPAYQQYTRYQKPSRRSGGGRFGKVIILIAIAVVVYLMIRAVLGTPGDSTLVDETNQPINTNGQTDTIVAGDETATNADLGNSNSNANTNTNAERNANVSVENARVSASECNQVFSRGDTTEKNITLTFNVGTTKEGALSDVVAALSSANVPADFFIRGDVAEENTSLVTMIRDAGFPLYNLTYDHQRATDLSEEELIDELDTAATAISEAGGGTSKPFFRPPYGAADDTVVQIAADQGYCTVTWTVDALDWSTEYTAADSTERVLDNASPGAIVLMQAGNATTAEIIPEIITALEDEGYTFVNLKTNLGL